MSVVDQSPSPLSPDELDAVKQKQQATWASGDFAVIGSSLQLTGERLCESLGIEAGQQVLDVAAGNGNAALAAARRNAMVTASDYVPELLEGAANRAAADGLAMTTRVADAEQLPFGDQSFDAVLSTFGVMFAPRQEQVATELIRVCRPGGRIGLASWTPDSFIGEMFRTVARFVSPPPVPSVFRWGNVDDVVELFGAAVEVRAATTPDFVFRYRSAEHFVDTFRRFYGPTYRAFAALDEDGRAGLERELVELARTWNRSTADALAVPATYLEVVAVVR